MTTVTTSSGASFTPKVRYTAGDTYPTRNKIYDLLGGDVAVTFGAMPRRTGTFDFMFEDELSAFTAYLIMRDGYVMQIMDVDDIGASPMNFVLSGDMTRTWDAETNTWTVSLDFQEVA